jgi:hypothetical protein
VSVSQLAISANNAETAMIRVVAATACLLTRKNVSVDTVENRDPIAEPKIHKAAHNNVSGGR